MALLLIAVPLFAIAIPPVLRFMIPSLRDISSYLYARLGESYNYLTDGEVARGPEYSVLRHSRPFVVYQGIKTTVPITVFGEHSLPKGRRIFLQRRGYRTAAFGWSIGSMLGGSKLPGIEVTPMVEEPFLSLPSSRQTQFIKEISRLFPPSLANSQIPLETMVIHIPVSSGDGYFRLRLTTDNPRKTIAESPVFRVGSLSLASAHPQGATILGLVPELLVRSAFIAVKTAAYGTFYASFPFLKVAEWTPGPWRQYALRALYSHSLSPEQQDQVTDSIARRKEQLRQANDNIYKILPFGAVGVRTMADLQKDEEIGRGGVWYDRTK